LHLFKMKKTIVTTVIVVVVTLIALSIFNKITTKNETAGLFTEVSSGKFEITVNTTGEIEAENSVDILGPAFTQGRDVRSTNIRITDLIPEGTEVKKGDFVASLDKTELDNSLKDFQDRVTTMQTDINTLLLDTAMTMNTIRDQINNQTHTVQEAEITLRNSKYEPPTTLRQAEINYDQAKRTLEQLKRSYDLKDAQTKIQVKNRRLFLSRMERRVQDYEDVLKEFVITAPADGMVIYKKDRFGSKRKIGAYISAVDRVVATLPDLTSMMSRVFISEIDIRKIIPGLPVNISVDAFPNKTYTGRVVSMANIGEKLPNSDTKVFEVLIKIDGNDPTLRPSMTTNNKILIKTLDNVAFIPNECVHAGTDSIPFVYTKSGHKQVVLLGESNDKEVVIKKGLEPGTLVYIATPENPEKFKMEGKELLQTSEKEAFNRNHK
jgi:HlyD family secretion protein